MVKKVMLKTNNYFKKNIYIGFILLILLFLIGSLESVKGNRLILNLKYIVYIIGIIYVFINNKLFFKFKNRRIYYILLTMIFGFMVLPLAGFFIKYDFQIILNVFLFFVYIIFLLAVSFVINKEKMFNPIIKVITNTLLLFIVFIIFKNGTDLLNVNNIITAFNIEDRYRQSYGLKHPNTLGNICFVFISLTVYRLFYTKQKKISIAIGIFSLLIVFLVMLTSGSRTALMSTSLLAVICAVNSVFVFKNKLLNRISIILNTLLTILLVLIAFYFREMFNIGELLAKSNRYYYWIDTIQYLNRHMNIFIGLGFVNISYFYSSYNFSTNLITDNWFLYTYMTLGVLGILSIIIIIGIILANFITYKGKYRDRAFSFFIGFFLVCIFYSSFEVTYFAPSELLSLINWILIFFYLEHTKTEDNL